MGWSTKQEDQTPFQTIRSEYSTLSTFFVVLSQAYVDIAQYQN